MSRMVLMAEVEGGYEGDRGQAGWCEGGLGQQWNDRRLREKEEAERVESPGAYVTE